MNHEGLTAFTKHTKRYIVFAIFVVVAKRLSWFELEFVEEERPCS